MTGVSHQAYVAISISFKKVTVIHRGQVSPQAHTASKKVAWEPNPSPPPDLLPELLCSLSANPVRSLPGPARIQKASENSPGKPVVTNTNQLALSPFGVLVTPSAKNVEVGTGGSAS